MKLALFLLNIISLLNLKESNRIKQLIWILLGYLLYIKIPKISKKYLKMAIVPLYIVLNLLLIYLLLKGEYTNGSKGWVTFGSISIQPSEFLKPVLILINTLLLKKRKKLLFFGTFLLPSILTFLEPDTGGVLFYGIIFLTFIPYYYSKKEITYYTSILFLLGSLCLVALYHKKIPYLETYRIERITSFLKQDNLQVQNAIISIGAQQELYFPEKYNDFFLAHILSTSIYYIVPILGSYVTILSLIGKKRNPIANSTYWILLFAITENISMNLGFLPVIGIPLPFLSYGGSNLLTNYILVTLSMDSKAWAWVQDKDTLLVEDSQTLV